MAEEGKEAVEGIVGEEGEETAEDAGELWLDFNDFHKVLDPHYHPIVGLKEGMDLIFVIKTGVMIVYWILALWYSWGSNFYYYTMGKSMSSAVAYVFILVDHLVLH